MIQRVPMASVTGVFVGPMPPTCGEVKPRLTKEQHEFLERQFQNAAKPTTSVKKGYAESLHVPIEKINNWFQNRRAKVKQDAKKTAMNNMSLLVPPFQPRPINGDRMPYISNSNHYFASTPNLHQPVSHSDNNGPYASSRLVSSQVSLTQDFSSSLQPISESAHVETTETAMDSGAAAGYNFKPDSMASSLLMDEHMFNSGVSENYPDFDEYSSAMDGSLSLADTSGIYGTAWNDSPFAFSNYSTSASASANNLGLFAASSDTSGVSATPSVAPSLCSRGPTVMPTLNTGLDDCANDGHSPATLASASQQETSADGSTSTYGNVDSASPQDMSMLDTGLPADTGHGLDWNGVLMQADVSTRPMLSSNSEFCDGNVMHHSPISFDQPRPLPEGAFDRRSSSVSVFADSPSNDEMQAQDFLGSGHNQVNKLPSTIASRRQRPRPAALVSASLRSSSYSSGVPASPGGSHSIDPDQTLRRIRSNGVMASRIQKPGIMPAQRSPLAMTFADIPVSNAAYVTGMTPGTAAPGGTLAPPTPMTPSGMGFAHMQSHNSMSLFDSLNMEDGSALPDVIIPWTGDFGAGQQQATESPPYTPMDKVRLNSTHSRASSNYQSKQSPPQSAPATQQMFDASTFAQCSLPMASTQLAGGYVNGPVPRQQHTRSPSMPVSSGSVSTDSPMAYAMPTVMDNQQFLYAPSFKQHSHLRGLSDVAHQFSQLSVPVSQPAPAAPSTSKPTVDLEVHQYSPPEHFARPSSPRKTPDTQPKNYVFSNQGLSDFQSD